MKTQSIANLSSETTSRVWQYLNAKSQVTDEGESDFFRDSSGISEKTDPLSAGHEPSDATDSFASSEKSINAPNFTAFLSCVEAGDLLSLRQLFEQLNSEGFNNTHQFFTSVDAKSRTPLHVAAEKGHAKVASFIVSVSPESLCAKLRDSFETPLHVAAKHGHAHVIEAMLTSARCTVASVATNMDSQKELPVSGHTILRAFDSCGLTPLHIAAEAGHVESVVCLIQNGADPMYFDHTRFSRSALRCAVENRKYEVVETMVSPRFQCDVNSPSGADSLSVLFSEICNPLASLSSNEADESMQMVRFLVEKAGANVEGAGTRLSALHLAALSNRDDVVRFLVCDRGMSSNMRTSPQESTPLHFAARASATKAIRELVCNLNADASLGDFDGLTPLHLAALVGARPSIVCLVTECGVDINLKNSRNTCQREGGQKNDITPLSFSDLRPIHCAVLSGKTDTVQMLAHDCSADLTAIAENKDDKEGFTPLHLAAALGFVNVIGELLEHGVDLSDLTPNRRDTILHTATRYDQLEVVHALLTDAGLHEIANNINAEDDTPFFIAVEKGNIAIASVLVNYGNVRVDSRNKSGETSLTVLARNNLPRRIEFIVGKLNADLQLRNADGSHALHLAAQLGHQEVVQCLIKLGCNPEMEDQKKDTAMGIAKKYSQKKVVEYLKRVTNLLS